MMRSLDHQPKCPEQIGAGVQPLPVLPCDRLHPVKAVLSNVTLWAADRVGAQQDRVRGVAGVQKDNLSLQQPAVKVFIFQKALVASKVMNSPSTRKGGRDDALNNSGRLPLGHGSSLSIVGSHSPMMERGARFSNRVPHYSLTSKDAA